MKAQQKRSKNKYDLIKEAFLYKNLFLYGTLFYWKRNNCPTELRLL